jgi:hypothetical protein
MRLISFAIPMKISEKNKLVLHDVGIITWFLLFATESPSGLGQAAAVGGN